MSCLSYDNFGRNEFHYNVSGKDKLQHENMTELRTNLTTIKEQT